MTRNRKKEFGMTDIDKTRGIVRVPEPKKAPRVVRIPAEAQAMLRHAMSLYEMSKRELQVRIESLRQGLAPEGFVLTQIPLSPANGKNEFELIFVAPEQKSSTTEE